MVSFFYKLLVTALFLSPSLIWGQNQTELLSPVFSEKRLPFTLKIEVADFQLPVGLQSYATAIYRNQWILFAGRTNGLHGFAPVGNNFPPLFQNRSVYLIDPKTGRKWERSLKESDLSAEEIDLLSVTASQFLQKGRTLYLLGGYGINSLTNEMGTKSTLTQIDLKKLVGWVKREEKGLKSAISVISHPNFQITGGFLYQLNDHSPFLLMLGQNFIGDYRDDSNGIYAQQIRPFWVNAPQFAPLCDNVKNKHPDYRRRDLNIVSVLLNDQFAYIAFAGVFTLQEGVWTVPITIFPDGSSFEPDPNDPKTFKQAMNHYNCPTIQLYSVRKKEMFVVFPGGISYGFFNNGNFETDAEIPFINQVTTIKIDKDQQFTQHLMEGEYPYLVSQGTNPGNQLLFGAEAIFFPQTQVPLFSNGVIQLDKLPNKPTHIGYIVGGIMSTLPDTIAPHDTTASPYIFKVTLIPK